MADDRLDMVIFGATGYTGKYVVKDMTHMCKEQKMKFDIAGRRKEALDTVVKEFASDIEKEDVSVILVDIQDEESLKKMTEQAKILINCCGPYRFYGEPVIKACIATRTHYIDVTAEEEFMRRMQLGYNETAKEAGIYVVSTCGLVCIPSDLGIIFTQQKFEGEINAVEVYIKVWSTDTDKKSPYMNYTSWESAIYNLAYPNELQKLHIKLYPTKLPEFTPKLKSRNMPHRSDVSEGWSVPYLSADYPVALRTQRFLYDKYKERPAQIKVYITFKSFFDFLMAATAGITLLCMSRTVCGRNLLLRYPTLFSCGLVTNKSLKPGMLTLTNFAITFKALGWTEKLAEPTDKHTYRPNKKVITKISSAFSAYEATSIIAILSAITIFNEADKMPENGGVFTPGATFGKTSLIEQMNKHNIKFEVTSSTVK